jgi:AraC-like DNA-binding protein
MTGLGAKRSQRNHTIDLHQLKSIKEIARDLKISRNTVRKILRSGETSFSYEREVPPRWVLPAALERVRRKLAGTDDGSSDSGHSRLRADGWLAGGRSRLRSGDVEGVHSS